VNSANPGTLVTKYQQIAAASKQLLRTDIPQEILPALIALGLKVKRGKVSNVDLNSSKNFPTGRNPNYEAMRAIVQRAIQPRPTKPVASTPSTTKKPGKKTTATPTKAAAGATQNLTDACAYNPTGG
jgi:hypothetical protein